MTPLTRPTQNKAAKPKNAKSTKIKLKVSAPQSKVNVKTQLTTKSLTPTTPTSSFGIDISEDEAQVPDDITMSAKSTYNCVLQTMYFLMGESLMPFSDFVVGPGFDKQVKRVVDLVLADKAVAAQKQLAESWKKQVSCQSTILISYSSIDLPPAVGTVHQKVVKTGQQNCKSS